MKRPNSQEAAGQVDEISRQIEQLCASVKAQLESQEPGELVLTAENLAYAAETAGNLRSYLRRWYSFYNGYDPLFTWWMRVPYEQADKALLEAKRSGKNRIYLVGTPNGDISKME